MTSENKTAVMTSKYKLLIPQSYYSSKYMLIVAPEYYRLYRRWLEQVQWVILKL